MAGLSIFGRSQVDTSGPVGIGARALSMVPGPLGIAGTLASLGMRANNVGYTNRARASWGQEGLGFGQTLGGLLGLNSYSGGGERDKLGDFRGVDVTPSGVSSRGGFLGIGSETTGAYTPGEAQKRDAAAKYGSPFGTPHVGPVAPAPVSVPTTSRPVYSKDAFDMGTYDSDPDPIGAAIRGMRLGASLNGGGRGQGGTAGARSGGGAGGRSDRSTMSSGRG